MFSNKQESEVVVSAAGRNQGSRITIVLPGFSKYPIGGYKVVYSYANYLAGQGHEVVLLHALLLKGARHKVKDFRRPIASILAGLRPHKKPDWFALDERIQFLTLPFLTPGLVRPTDYIVATEVQTATLVASVAGKTGIPGSYFIQHYEDWSAAPDFIDSTWKLPLKKIVIAPWLEEHMHTLGEDCDLIPNGIDPIEFPSGPETDARVNDVCAMVSDVPWKRADLIVQVLNSLGEKYPNFRAVTFGTCDRPESLGGHVQHIKNPSKTEIRNSYQSSKIYLCASDAEGWHLPPAEAMSSGCAVVSTDIGGVRAYADGTALFSPVGDAEALRTNVERLMEDAELCNSLATQGMAAMRQNTPALAASRFEAAVLGRS
ncbi:glycosyl transferases group 1 family protein [Pseudarthrobacter siccitolerans]|uniref:Glycosyl transferases group 1 family protein n=1 Tax=Pseudarthrobacter siccitolerans TaxID=861266 RepID=A0A024H064_9MICC|nr:glycosyltransferase family 4 protein [Pseudarthrobacter siccitolerans]CCQ45570.1 glycosyl transferases group 1 family protein [Pseudarthrobacter siccitolerans]